MTEIEIQPDQILDVLQSKQNSIHGEIPAGEEVLMVCDGVNVCKAEREDGAWRVLSLACDNPSHGVHPRYRERYAALRDKLERLQHVMPLHGCSKCDGSGWLAADAPEARKQILMSVTLRMFRGIPLPVAGQETEKLMEK